MQTLPSAVMSARPSWQRQERWARGAHYLPDRVLSSLLSPRSLSQSTFCYIPCAIIPQRMAPDETQLTALRQWLEASNGYLSPAVRLQVSTEPPQLTPPPCADLPD